MAYRFWRRVKIAPGVTLNLSKSGPSLSLGPRGAKFTVGPRGKRLTMGLPGSGLFYTTTPSSSRAPAHRPKTSAEELEVTGRSSSVALAGRYGAAVPLEQRLTLGFFQRLITPEEEKALVKGCRELVAGNEEAAFARAREAVHLADGAFLAGFLAMKQGLLEEAATYLNAAAEDHVNLGRLFSKYGLSVTMTLPVTDEIMAQVAPDLRGVLLALTEVYQRTNRSAEAIACLRRLQELEPEDVVVRLSLAELLMETSPSDQEVCREVLRLAEDVQNQTPVHAALLLYKARALRALGLLATARETLSVALRRTQGRPRELIWALRYERALVYEAQGEARRARAELEKLYADAPDFADVAERLGLKPSTATQASTQ